MQLKRFDRADEYFSQVEAFLLQNEAEHNLILGLCGQLISGQHRYEAPFYMAYVEKAGEIIAAALRTPPFNVILSQTEDESVVPLFVEDIACVYASVQGILGRKHLSKAFAKQWAEKQKVSYGLKMSQGVYRLEKVKPAAGVSGALRRATEAERDLLAQWMMGFNQDALEPISLEYAQKIVDGYFTSDTRAFYLWYDGGQPVSVAGSTRPTRNGKVVGAVYTPPEFRRRGYASACVAALSQQILDSGCKFCFLFTDLANPTSNHIYQEIGYEYVGDMDEYRFYQ